MPLYDEAVNIRRTVGGHESKTLQFPSKLKIQITGPGAETIIEDGPPEGRKWTVLLTLECKESDV